MAKYKNDKLQEREKETLELLHYPTLPPPYRPQPLPFASHAQGEEELKSEEENVEKSPPALGMGYQPDMLPVLPSAPLIPLAPLQLHKKEGVTTRAQAQAASARSNVGDKIEFNRGAYYHVAVFWGKEKGQDMVVHVTGGKSSHKVNNELDQTYSAKNPSKIKEYLEKSIGKKWNYNLADNNCEHFANQARYDQHFSSQFYRRVLQLYMQACVILEHFGNKTSVER
ncbi:PA216 protein, partial [Polypterus senegalus]|nr:PA216 protein [Polypterus senegalus]